MLGAITKPPVWCQQISCSMLTSWRTNCQTHDKRRIIKVCLLTKCQKGTAEVLYGQTKRKVPQTVKCIFYSAPNVKLYESRFAGEVKGVTTRLCCCCSCWRFRVLWSAGIPSQRAAPSWSRLWETGPWHLRPRAKGWPWPSHQAGTDAGTGVFSLHRVEVLMHG